MLYYYVEYATILIVVLRGNIIVGTSPVRAALV